MVDPAIQRVQLPEVPLVRRAWKALGRESDERGRDGTMMPELRTETINAIIRATTVRVVGAADRGHATHARPEIISTRDETLTRYHGEMNIMK